MAYATVPDVKSRAGVLAKAWGQDTQPGDTDLARFLDITAGEVDAFIGAQGYGVPITDEIAVGSLVGVNADEALLLAIDATWPGGKGGVADLRAQVWERVQAYRQAAQDGDIAAVLYLGAQSATEGGASNYWENDARNYQYPWWAGRVGGWAFVMSVDPYGLPLTEGPRFTRTDRF